MIDHTRAIVVHTLAGWIVVAERLQLEAGALRITGHASDAPLRVARSMKRQALSFAAKTAGSGLARLQAPLSTHSLQCRTGCFQTSKVGTLALRAALVDLDNFEETSASRPIQPACDGAESYARAMDQRVESMWPTLVTDMRLAPLMPPGRPLDMTCKHSAYQVTRIASEPAETSDRFTTLSHRAASLEAVASDEEREEEGEGPVDEQRLLARRHGVRAQAVALIHREACDLSFRYLRKSATVHQKAHERPETRVTVVYGISTYTCLCPGPARRGLR